MSVGYPSAARRHRRLLLRAAVALVFAWSPFIALDAAFADEAGARVSARAYLEQWQAKSGAPGVSAAVCVGDRVVFSDGVGVADLESGAPITGTTVHNIGSVSKPLAVIAVMQLVEQGKVQLDAEIQRYVPWFPRKSAPITVRQVLTHTSGIRHYKDGEFGPANVLSFQHFDQFEEATRRWRDEPLLFEPGTRYEYSSFTTSLMHAIVESASGEPFEAYLSKHVWRPAGMIGTQFDVAARVVKNRGRGYERDEKSGELRNPENEDVSYKYASGGMLSTDEDLCRFGHALNAGKLLKPATIAEMYRLQLRPDLPSFGDESAKPPLPAATMGLIFRVAPDASGRVHSGHGGSVKSTLSQLINYYKEDVVVALHFNYESSGDIDRLEAAETLAALFMPAAATKTAKEFEARVNRALAARPVIDGHNDLPWEIRDRFAGDPVKLDLNADTSKLPPPKDMPALMTDLPRMKAGRVGAQFWSVWIPVEIKGHEAVQTTIEQIDLVKRMAAAYPSQLEMAYTAADIRRVHKTGRIASLIGIEGGHQINDSLAVLRQMYALGARYMTLTHSTGTSWADSATDAPRHDGLTPFGQDVVKEMNRLGMMVDLSHVSPATMRAALAVSQAPVMFSHSSARALVDHPRNVPDDVLQLVARNRGIVMITFATPYVSSAMNAWRADRAAEQARLNTPPFAGMFVGQPDRAAAALAEWDAKHPKPPVTLSQVADHVEQVRRIAGVDHVGLGGDFDGMADTPAGLEGTDKYPMLLAELMRRGWKDEEIRKVAGENLLRVFADAEAVGVSLRKSR